MDEKKVKISETYCINVLFSESGVTTTAYSTRATQDQRICGICSRFGMAMFNEACSGSSEFN